MIILIFTCLIIPATVCGASDEKRLSHFEIPQPTKLNMIIVDTYLQPFSDLISYERDATANYFGNKQKIKRSTPCARFILKELPEEQQYCHYVPVDIALQEKTITTPIYEFTLAKGSDNIDPHKLLRKLLQQYEERCKKNPEKNVDFRKELVPYLGHDTATNTIIDYIIDGTIILDPTQNIIAVTHPNTVVIPEEAHIFFNECICPPSLPNEDLVPVNYTLKKPDIHPNAFIPLIQLSKLQDKKAGDIIKVTSRSSRFVPPYDFILSEDRDTNKEWVGKVANGTLLKALVTKYGFTGTHAQMVRFMANTPTLKWVDVYLKQKRSRALAFIAGTPKEDDE